MLELRNISIKYGERTILDIPHLQFVEGKRYGLIGQNGSGQTTLLRILAGTLKPTTGEISGIQADGMGYMPQAPYAFSFSVLRNVKMALERNPQRESLAIQALQNVGMGGMLTARGDKLSGGEAQRIACARIIAKPRSLILLDEPTSSTDIRGMDHIENILLQYAQNTGCTMIFSTHSPAQALRLAEEVIFLDQGRIVEQGLAAQVLMDPQSERAKLFLAHWRI